MNKFKNCFKQSILYLKAFTAFLKLEYADENISFYESTECLKARDSIDFFSASIDMQKTFLSPNGEKGN